MQDLYLFKKQISDTLTEFIETKTVEFSRINQWGNDLLLKIKKFALNGKMLRGCLILQIENLLQNTTTASTLKAAAVIEFFQSALLIHDDIMDQDFSRRGNQTIFYQYHKASELKNSEKSYHFGEGMGICAGDICFFLGFELLSALDISQKLKDLLYAKLSQELSYVGLAQMQDLYAEITTNEVNEADILNLYRYKTARYTFSLPFMTAGILCGLSNLQISELDLIGENLGIIFQIKDDELGLFSTEETIGKPSGSDIKKGKKTLYYHYLFTNINENQKVILNSIFGNPNVNEHEINYVLQLIQYFKIDKQISSKLSVLKQETEVLIEKSNFNNALKVFLKELLNYNLERSK